MPPIEVIAPNPPNRPLVQGERIVDVPTIGDMEQATNRTVTRAGMWLALYITGLILVVPAVQMVVVLTVLGIS